MKRVLFLANHFITLFSFRKELIRKLIDHGNEVYLSLPESEENQYFINLGCKILPTEIDRRGINPVSDLKLFLFYMRMISRINPTIIFSYTIKPNIYGSIASNITKHKQICNITGTGATFLQRSGVNIVCKMLYKLSIKKCYKVYFQNSGDRDFFIKNRMIKDNYEMLPGSGCNLEEYPYCDMPDDSNIKFIFIGRVMKLKGIDEYLECAKSINTRYPNTTFFIAGWNEEEHYKKIIEDYQQQGYVEYIGFRKDISDWMRKCHCTVLPSHGGEGVPNVLLESAATGRICIATNIAGSREVIVDGETGFLFQVADVDGLIKTVEKVINLSKEKRTQMGVLGRGKVEYEFNRKDVVDKYCAEVISA